MHDPGHPDDYTIRLTKQPLSGVDVAILTDGMVDVTSINGVAITPRAMRRSAGPDPDPALRRQPRAQREHDHARQRLRARQLLRRRLPGRRPDPARRRGGRARRDRILTVTDDVLTVSAALPGGNYTDVTISHVTREGLWEGAATISGQQVIRSDASSWLGDGFLEGQWVEI